MGERVGAPILHCLSGLTLTETDVVVSSAGMILTLKDTGVPECVLSGPPQLVRLPLT